MENSYKNASNKNFFHHKIYGIKNCDTVKKAFKWLEANNIEYQFHDYKKEGVDEALLDKDKEMQFLERITKLSKSFLKDSGEED